MEERQDEGFCYTCEEKFHYGHKCNNKMLIMSVKDEEEEYTGVDGEEHAFDTAEEEMRVELSLIHI